MEGSNPNERKFIATVELVGFYAEAEDNDERHALAHDHAEKVIDDINAGGSLSGDGPKLEIIGVRETD